MPNVNFEYLWSKFMKCTQYFLNKPDLHGKLRTTGGTTAIASCITNEYICPQYYGTRYNSAIQLLKICLIIVDHYWLIIPKSLQGFSNIWTCFGCRKCRTGITLSVGYTNLSQLGHRFLCFENFLPVLVYYKSKPDMLFIISSLLNLCYYFQAALRWLAARNNLVNYFYL